MTDDEMIEALQSIQAEAYLQSSPFGGLIAQKLKFRMQELVDENKKLNSVRWAVHLIEENIEKGKNNVNS